MNGLWAFVCSPVDVSQEMINTAYAIGEFVSAHSAEECFQCVVPELRELSLSWDILNDHDRGQKIGYIIGKYGVDIFATGGVLKGIHKVRAMKRANTMLTLESCAASEANQAIILEESARRAIARTTLIESAKKGKIFVQNSNVQHHIMQLKHAWNKVITLSGNIEQDFAKVVSLIEENNIIDKCFLKDKPQLFPKNFPKVSKAEYEKLINGYKIHVEIVTYLETGETFLNDAWVVTK